MRVALEEHRPYIDCHRAASPDLPGAPSSADDLWSALHVPDSADWAAAWGQQARDALVVDGWSLALVIELQGWTRAHWTAPA